LEVENNVLKEGSIEISLFFGAKLMKLQLDDALAAEDMLVRVTSCWARKCELPSRTSKL
jgi:hypothetical protein